MLITLQDVIRYRFSSVSTVLHTRYRRNCARYMQQVLASFDDLLASTADPSDLTLHRLICPFSLACFSGAQPACLVSSLVTQQASINGSLKRLASSFPPAVVYRGIVGTESFQSSFREANLQALGATPQLAHLERKRVCKGKKKKKRCPTSSQRQ